MKSDDALLAAWEETLARKGDAPAVFGTKGEVQRTFREVEIRARELTDEISGPVHLIDIGNQPDWPSHLVAALRRRVVALPLESSITPQQRENALRLSEKGDWNEQQTVLLKLTSGTTAAPRFFHIIDSLRACGPEPNEPHLSAPDANADFVAADVVRGPGSATPATGAI